MKIIAKTSDGKITAITSGARKAYRYIAVIAGAMLLTGCDVDKLAHETARICIEHGGTVVLGVDGKTNCIMPPSCRPAKEPAND